MNGERYLGEQLSPLEAGVGSDCDAMNMVRHSPAFLACVDHLARVANCEASIRLFGESAVGKQLAARFIHARSVRSGSAFILINCAAVPEDLSESELFGHERGSFFGSSGLKKGLTAARCSWTRSPRFQWACSRRCRGFGKPANSGASVAPIR